MLTWFFDLDNTLHDASHRIFPAINTNMNQYIAQVLAEAGMPSDIDSVNAARINYWQRYGATLLGMVRHHQVRPDDFLLAAHRFDDLRSMIRAESGLGDLLRRLPGRKILLTNAPAHYARQVLRHLGLHRQFTRSIAIEDMRVHGKLRPKPSRAMLRQLIAKKRLAPSRCVLVEDTLGNLKAAHRLGFQTVWITRYGIAAATPSPTSAVTPAATLAPSAFIKRPHYVDVKVKSLKQLSGQYHRLR